MMINMMMMVMKMNLSGTRFGRIERFDIRQFIEHEFQFIQRSTRIQIDLIEQIGQGGMKNRIFSP